MEACDDDGGYAFFDEAELAHWRKVRPLLAPQTLDAVSEGLIVRMVRSLPTEAPKDVAKALDTTVSWRLEYGVDGLLRERAPLWEEYHSAWGTAAHGVDDRGRLIYAERVKTLDSDALHRDVPTRDLIRRNRAQDMEILDVLQARTSAAKARATEATAAAGAADALSKARTEHLHIFDLDGLTRNKLNRQTINTVVDIVAMSLAQYPGALGAMWLVNAPLVFQILWRLLRPMLSAETIAKISILGGPDAYLPKMVAAGIPASQLPDWMVSEKHGLRGGSEGTPLADYVKALGDPRARADLVLPVTNSLQLKPSFGAPPGGDATPPGATSPAVKVGLARKRGRHTAYLRRPLELNLAATGVLSWTKNKRHGSCVCARARHDGPESRYFTVESADRAYRFKVATADDARDWVSSIEANSTLVEVERLPPPSTPRKQLALRAPTSADDAAAPAARLAPLVPAGLLAAALLLAVYRLFGIGAFSYCVTSLLAIAPRYFRVVTMAANPCGTPRGSGGPPQ